MSHSELRLKSRRSLRLEAFEHRLVLAHPSAEVQSIEPASLGSIGDDDGSGVAYAHHIGLTGLGQTVAVIDSGIAYDHAALGGGYGSDYRVVGGWDFTEENDGDPFDDAPAGLHGTHIAGIIGSQDETHGGIAPDVDLVALRVFNDQGEGKFEWIENALQWVIDHKDNFEHPITTVNLSLGTKWKGSDVPKWATLEDEFVDLYQQGIFVAVAAGNDFQDQPVVGLSYPAASPHVVAVASHDQDGIISDFSRRSDGVLVAPGEAITSTAPDYLYDFNGITDDFFTASGTSMATPFVSGASVLVRQAFEQLGVTSVSVDQIYEVLQTTGDRSFDQKTGQHYHHVNLEAALKSILPTDDYGSTPATAHSVGSIDTEKAVSGTIGTTRDVDYFSFTPSQSGVLRLRTSDTNSFVPQWFVGRSATHRDGGIEIEVHADQSYEIGIGSASGTGTYEFIASMLMPSIDLGEVTFNEFTGSPDTRYEVRAHRTGTLTIQTGAKSSLPAQISVFEAGLQTPIERPLAADLGRIDLQVSAGDRFSFELSEHTDVQLLNLVSIQNNVIDVFGTNNADEYLVSFNNKPHLSINSIPYIVSAFDTLRIHGEAGLDTMRVHLSERDETVHFSPQAVHVSAGRQRLESSGIENAYVYSGGGNDTGFFFDSAGDDRFTALPDYSVLSGPGFFNYAHGFTSIKSYSRRGGSDKASLFDSEGSDDFTGHAAYSLFAGAEFRNYAEGFTDVRAYSKHGGKDTATLYDSSYDDTYHGLSSYSVLTTPNESRLVQGFHNVRSYAIHGGDDTARLYDSRSDDTFYALPEYALFESDTFRNYARGFEKVRAYSFQGGKDVARLYDSDDDDVFTGLPDYSVMQSEHFDNFVSGFASVRSYSHGEGDDVANLYGSTGNDHFYGLPQYAVLRGTGYDNYAEGFDRVFADGNQAGFDRVDLYDSSSDDLFIGAPNYWILSGVSFLNAASGFESLRLHAQSGGNDRAVVKSAKADRVFSDTKRSSAFMNTEYQFETHDFSAQPTETLELHRVLTELTARDDFYRSVSAAIDSNYIEVNKLLKDDESDARNVETFGFDVIDRLLQDAKEWI